MTDGPLFSVISSDSLAAHLALRDAQLSLREFRDATGEDWRRRWVAVLTLLRSVGHVLHYVDGETSVEYRTTIDDWWNSLKKSKPEPPIFWHFIEQARNTVLKQYYPSVSVEIHSPPESQTGMNIVLGVEGSAFGVIPEEGVEARYCYSEPPFEGQDPEKLAEEAIEWWKSQLSLIVRESGAAG